ncbi:hypothetical protein [Roseovarius ramblicola]|uniref:Uncharacterized protein n=1 Tax=Roseovarius ramblicola TaxID=2022336 RepID=A0ABV5HWC9_9RHOB
MVYADGMEVELFDQVGITIGGRVFSGQITCRHPRKETVRVGYFDTEDTKKNGDGRWKVATVPVAQVELVARDG